MTGLVFLTALFSAQTVSGVVPSLPPVIEPKEGGRIDWTNQVIRAKGWGVIDTTLPRPQAKLMAQRAAVVIAQRNLLEIIKGVNVTSETKVLDMMTKSDYVYTRIEGVVKGARMVKGPIEKDGIIEVELEVSIYDTTGIAPLLQETLIEGTKLMSSPKLLSGTPKNIVIDASKTSLKPAIFPKIRDKEGNVLLDFSKYPEISKYKEAIKYVKLGKENIKNLEAFKNHLIIKGIDAIGSDIVISDKDKEKINLIKKGLQFLIKAGKIIWMLL